VFLIQLFLASLIPIILIGGAVLASAIKIVREYERGVIFRLGRIVGAKGPGLIIIIPVVDKMVKVDLRTITMDVPPQEVITKDNVPIKVDAVVYFRVFDAVKAVIEVADFVYATSQISQTTLRSILGQVELDEVLAKREKINRRLQEIIDKETDPWGIKVSTVEIKAVELPEGMKRAMAKQAEAERERRAKIISAEGEFQAAEKLYQAAKKIAQEPIALQLRFLQTLTEVAAEKNSTTIFPIPIDLFEPFIKYFRKKGLEERKKEGK
jgi:regulator of protease activity HflC (stomatin/prohibitin superfamily)